MQRFNLEESTDFQSSVPLGITYSLGQLCRYRSPSDVKIDIDHLERLIEFNPFLEFTVNPDPNCIMRTGKTYNQSSHRMQKGEIDRALKSALKKKEFKGCPAIYIYECGSNGSLHVHGFILRKSVNNLDLAVFQKHVHSRLGRVHLKRSICCMCTWSETLTQRNRWLNYMIKSDETSTDYEPILEALPYVAYETF